MWNMQVRGRFERCGGVESDDEDTKDEGGEYYLFLPIAWMLRC
jgi:hypothetical protein